MSKKNTPARAQGSSRIQTGETLLCGHGQRLGPAVRAMDGVGGPDTEAAPPTNTGRRYERANTGSAGDGGDYGVKQTRNELVGAPGSHSACGVRIRVAGGTSR